MKEEDAKSIWSYMMEYHPEIRQGDPGYKPKSKYTKPKPRRKPKGKKTHRI